MAVATCNVMSKIYDKYVELKNKDKIDITREKVSVDINNMSNKVLKNIITSIKLILE